MKTTTSFVLTSFSPARPLAKGCFNNRALDFTSSYDTIGERVVILQAKKSLLSHNKDLWQKKSNTVDSQ